MKAQWFVFRPGSRLQPTHAVVWVPELELQFQWVQPVGPVQIFPASRPIQPNVLGVLLLEGERYLPYPLVRAVNRYLKDRKRQTAQAQVLKMAMDRLHGGKVSSENHLQAAATKFLLGRQAGGKEQRSA